MQENAAVTTARILLETQAVLAKIDPPFTLTSGRKSPVYVDCRRLISFPRARRELMRLAVEAITTRIGFESLDVIAGGETAGIPFAAWIAEAMGLPMIYVRKQPKGFGRNAQIEGVLPEGARVLLVEDLATDGTSKLKFAEALRQAGARIEHSFVIFHYGIFRESAENMKKAGIDLLALATWHDVLATARDLGYFKPDVSGEVERFLRDPHGWDMK